MTPVPRLRTGEAVVLTTAAGQEVPALVGLVTANGEQVILVSEALIAGWVGYVPVRWIGAAWQTLNGGPVWLRSAGPSDPPPPAPRGLVVRQS